MGYTDKEIMCDAARRDLACERWKKSFFREDIFPFSSLFEAEERVRLAPFFPSGGFARAEEVAPLLRQCLEDSVEEIFTWLLETRRRVLRLEFQFDESIGYTVSSRDGEKEPSGRVILALRRDEGADTKYCCFVSAFQVVYKKEG